ncbi:MAG: hypothetical protein H0W74_13180 [Sphingosinicella sp.]|nr:hypothetical protein [Sphingosinicella sp.]
MQPPRDLLDWGYWRTLRPVSNRAKPVGVADHYTVRLKGFAGSLGQGWQIDRRRGRWFGSETGNDAGALFLTVDNGAMRGQYRAEAGGQPVSLSLGIIPPEQQQSVVSSYKPLEPVRQERIAGEECVWSEATLQGEIVVVSGQHETCVTADGIPLRIFSHHRVLSARFTATALDRSPPSLSDFKPTARAFDWKAWGVKLKR